MKEITYAVSQFKRGRCKKTYYHADVFLKNEQEIDLAGFHIRVFHTRDIRWVAAIISRIRM